MTGVTPTSNVLEACVSAGVAQIVVDNTLGRVLDTNPDKVR